MSEQIDSNTPIEAVQDNRANLVRLARHVFGRTETSAMKVFGQFQNSADLVRLINAKRAGIFDFGTLITATPTGFSTPPVPEVLAQLTAAENTASGSQEKTKLDVTPPVDSPPPGVDPQPVDTQVKEEIPNQAQSGYSQSPGPARRDHDTPAVGVDLTGLIAPVMSRLEEIENGLREAFTTLDNHTMTRIGTVLSDVDSLRTGCRGLVGYLDVLSERQKVIATYLDEYAQLPEPSEAVKSDLGNFFRTNALQGAVETGVGQVLEKSPEPTAPIIEVAKVEESAPVKEAVVQNGADHQTVEYTKEQLTDIGNKDLNALRKIADSVGVPNAAATPFAPVLVQRILGMQNQKRQAGA